MAAREFAYDPLLGPRARYLAADYHPASGNDPNTWTPIEPMSWTDYDSLLPYADLELAAAGEGGWELTGVRRYFGTVGDESGGWGGQPLTSRVYHQDMLGSTALVTDETGTPAVPPAGAGSVAYTAFGELLCGRGGEPPGAGDPEACEVGSPGGTAPEGFPRYQYAGGWGYESGGFGEDPFGLGTDRSLLALGGVNPRLAPIRLLHVGWRWYQPDIGRFIQRDPLGIAGGLNCYACVEARPVQQADPWGLGPVPPIPPNPLDPEIAKILEKWLRARTPGLKAFYRRLFQQVNRWRMKEFARGKGLGPLGAWASCMWLYQEALEAARPTVDDWIDDLVRRHWNGRLRRAGFGPSRIPGELPLY